MTDLLPKAERTFLNKTRRLVETVIGQLTGQFNMNKVWARKSWTLVGRFSRKMLAHGLGMLANVKLNNKLLQLEGCRSISDTKIKDLNQRIELY
jgi:hypothetical protein